VQKNFWIELKKNITNWLISLWFLAWLLSVLYFACVTLLNRKDLIQLWIYSFVLILGHLLFFFKVSHPVLRFLVFLIQMFGLGLFVFSIWNLNSEGTTWGVGPALEGLVFLIPSLNVLWGSSRCIQDQKIGWYAALGGVVGISMTYWRNYNVDQKLEAGLEFWRPIPLYQSIGLYFSIVLVIAGVIHILTKSTVRGSN